jgi:hypothetical protein
MVTSTHNAIGSKQRNAKWSPVQDRLILGIDPFQFNGTRLNLGFEIIPRLFQGELRLMT